MEKIKRYSGRGWKQTLQRLKPYKGWSINKMVYYSRGGDIKRTDYLCHKNNHRDIGGKTLAEVKQRIDRVER